jgi:hypothetical protein
VIYFKAGSMMSIGVTKRQHSHKIDAGGHVAPYPFALSVLTFWLRHKNKSFFANQLARRGPPKIMGLVAFYPYNHLIILFLLFNLFPLKLPLPQTYLKIVQCRRPLIQDIWFTIQYLILM